MGPKEPCIIRFRWGADVPHGFDAAFAKLLWPLIIISYKLSITLTRHGGRGYVGETSNDVQAINHVTHNDDNNDSKLLVETRSLVVGTRSGRPGPLADVVTSPVLA